MDVRVALVTLVQRGTSLAEAKPCLLCPMGSLQEAIVSALTALPAAGYPCAQAYTRCLSNNLPRRAAVALPSLCHLRAGVGGLVVRLEEGEKGPTGD